MDRIILHSDLNGFYAAVECFYRPEIRHLPVAVCGDGEARHGIVLAKNEIAKGYGIKTGQVVWEARQLCPSLVTVTADFSRYIRFSSLAKKIYRRYSDRVESFGIDECWIDVSACGVVRGKTAMETGRLIADEIREAIKYELGITASVGVSWNKIYAKLGSDIKKPDATTVISRENYKQTIFNLPASDLLMVGRATKAKLINYGISTIGQLAGADIKFLKQRLGKWGEYIWLFAGGFDNSPVASYDDDVMEKSVGNSTTTIRDLKTTNDIKMIVTVLAESVASRLRDNAIKGNVVHLGLRDKDLDWWGKQTTISRPTFISGEIIEAAMSLFKSYNFAVPVRSVSVKVAGICPAAAAVQTNMFVSEQQQTRKEKLEFVTDEIRNRFGHHSINRGIEYLDKPLTKFNPKGENTIHPDSYL